MWLPADDADDRTLERLAASFAGVDEVRVVRACRSCGSDRHGKPQVVGAPAHVSLSRAGGLAVVAVTDAGPVGVDLELTASTTRELPDVAAWVRAESIVKATGHGLMVDPDTIEVSTPGSAMFRFDLECPEGFVAVATVLSGVRPRLVSQAAPAG